VEALVVVGLLVALAVAAPRWGVDTRPTLASRELEQATFGLGWAARPFRVGSHVVPERSALTIALRARRSERDRRLAA
jgi:hypothetical protein